MSRYLPRDYVPIPDALLWSGADLVDVIRRIARNQNWIWANHGNVLAAFGAEPMTAQTPSVSGAGTSLDCAYFACPNRSATLSDQVRCRGYVTTTGTPPIDFRVRLYQLLPGENTPTSVTPYDEIIVATIGTDISFSFNAKIRSGADPLRFCLRIVGSSAGSLTLLSCTVTWATPSTPQVLGETVEAWNAISQSYVAADRPMSAAFLRALSNRTLKLVAENPRPIFAHSFLWPRISTAAAGAETRVALYSVRHDGITTPKLYGSWGFFVLGQNAAVTFKMYVNGTLFATQASNATALVDGVWVNKFLPIGFASGAIPTGDVKVEVTAQCTVGATAPPTYCTNVGAVLTHVGVAQLTRTAADLGLPGAETVPALYSPIDESACVPGRSVVARDDRLGRRAGPYYLVRNLVWLAANRTAHVLVADWLHRTQSGAVPQYNWNAGTNTFPWPSDGVWRNESVFAGYVSGADLRDPTPEGRDIIPFADRTNPTDSRKISAGGQHFIGDTLGEFFCRPMNAGQIAAVIRTDTFYAPGGGAVAQEVPQWATAAEADLEFFFDTTRDIRAPMGRQGSTGNFRTLAPGTARPSAGIRLSLRANAGLPSGAGNAWWARTVARWGLQAALHAAYIYEAPLSQGELDALA